MAESCQQDLLRYPKRLQISQGLWRNLEPLVDKVHKSGGKIAFEWPEMCKYWKWQPVKDLIQRYNLQFA